MKWYIPSWNGDLRLEPSEDGKLTKLTIVKPTLAEIAVVNDMGKAFEEKKWLSAPWETVVKKRFFCTTTIIINAPLEEVGLVATPIMRPGKQVLTAIRFKGGNVEVVNGQEPEKLRDLAEKAKKEDAPAAATVRRPTPSCPQCVPGSIAPATETLLAFLTEEQHESWAKDRSIVVEGGLSGNRYLLSHRHSPFAQRAGRMCYDIDDRFVVHFHDWTVPPEEEVLAAKLILEHREAWLRNEATCLQAPHAKLVFKNPFGGYLDGVPDANFSQAFGRTMKFLLS